MTTDQALRLLIDVARKAEGELEYYSEHDEDTHEVLWELKDVLERIEGGGE